MPITAIKVRLHNADARIGVLAFVSIEFDDAFIVRDLKVIRREDDLLVAMPSRRYEYRCQNCGYKNHTARYCNDCGKQLVNPSTASVRQFTDVAHPLTTEFRNSLHAKVLAAFHEEVAKQPVKHA